MTLRLDPEKAKKLGIAIPKKAKKPPKYRNRRSIIPEQVLPGLTLPEAKFPSRREARCYLAQVNRWRQGEIRYFLRQVPIWLPGGVRMVIDFMVVPIDGDIEWIDAKGKATPAWTNKAKTLKSCYGIDIQLW